MGEFKGFMKYEKQALSELSLIDRLSNHHAFQQRLSGNASTQGAISHGQRTTYCQSGSILLTYKRF